MFRRGGEAAEARAYTARCRSQRGWSTLTSLRMTPPPAVFVALGANLGDRERNLARGVRGLAQRGLRLVRVPLLEIAAVVIYGPPRLLG